MALQQALAAVQLLLLVFWLRISHQFLIQNMSSEIGDMTAFEDGCFCVVAKWVTKGAWKWNQFVLLHIFYLCIENKQIQTLFDEIKDLTTIQYINNSWQSVGCQYQNRNGAVNVHRYINQLSQCHIVINELSTFPICDNLRFSYVPVSQVLVHFRSFVYPRKGCNGNFLS